MSDYWKKKKDELNKSSAKSSSSSSNYWDKKMSELKEAEKKKDEELAPVRSQSDTNRGVQTKQVGRYTFGGGSGRGDKESAKTAESEERTYLTAGKLKDGVTVGNIAKSILGTDADILENIGTGARKMAENAVDAGLHAVSLAGKMLGADEFSSNVDRVIAQDILGENSLLKNTNIPSALIPANLRPMFDAAKGIKALNAAVNGDDVDEASVLGERADSLIQTATRVALTRGSGLPWQAVTGVTSYGGEVESALNEGATTGEAGVSAAITAGGEILGEYLLGGMVGETGLDDALIKSFSRNISNKTLRGLLKFGVKAGGEGLIEEPFSWAIGKIGQKLTYADETTWRELFTSEQAVDELVESVIGGLFVGGVFQGADVVQSYQSGRDYASGLTANEQKVVDKVYNDRVAEAEKNGKISEKEKSKIYDEVLDEMEKGGISTDTIEEVLGGETYQNYQNAVKNEDSLRETFNQLNQMKQGDMTGEQIDLRNELKEQLKELESTNERGQLKSRLSDEVLGMVKGDRLAESYNERYRRGQAFEADLTKYNEKQRAVVQKAIDSGILNNTRRTHEFVDMVSKIAADKGVLFDFTNNEKLKGSSFAVDGKTVNGFVTKDGVTLNIDSAKSLNSVVGHEITHVLEGTEVYTELQNILKSYAESKGEYQSRYDSIAKLYEGIEGANIDAELTADLVGDYLFTDADFIHNLSTNHRNVFQKIYDEIKYLCKVATAGSKEAKQLLEVQRAFEKAYKADGKVSNDTKYSVSDSSYTDAVNKNDTETAQKMVDEAAKKAGYTLKQYHGTFANFNEFKIGDIGYHIGTKGQAESRVRETGLAPEYADKTPRVMELYAKLKNPLYAAFDFGDWHGKNVAGMLLETEQWEEGYHERAAEINARLSEIAAMPNNAETDRVLREYLESLGYDGIVYDNQFEDVSSSSDYSSGESFIVFNSNQLKYADAVTYDDSGNVIPLSERFNDKKADIRYSVSDSDGKQLSKEQQEYFKDSKMRDENGNLKVMYHGSQDAGFHVFDAARSDDGISLFFVDRNDVAASYSGTYETYEAKSFRTVEDANNFFKEIGKPYYEVVEQDGKFVLLENGDFVAESDTTQGIYEEYCDWDGVGYGDANYKVYLNLKNPLEVDAKGAFWNMLNVETDNKTVRYEVKFISNGKWKIVDNLNGGYLEIDRMNSYRTEAYAREALNDYISKNPKAQSIVNAVLTKTRDVAEYAKAKGYDGVIFKNIRDNGGYSNGSEGASTVAIAFDSNQIKSVANDKPTVDKDIRYSLSDSDYLDAVNRGDTDNAQLMVDEAAKAAGYTIRAYHGTSRSDRVGNVFLPERATSGPMAFFTDSKEIAENYARDKADTSLAYDEEYEDYYSQFRVNKNGKSIKVQDLWRTLPFAEKQRIKEAGKHITLDDEAANIIWDDDATHGLGNWDAYTLNLHKGNAIEALIDSWLEGGTLYGSEGDFVKVLEMAGIKGVEYRDPDARHEKVYDTWLKIQKPFDTATVDDSFADGFEEWYSQQPEGKYDRDTAGADMWDKNSQTAETFLERLRFDIKAGTSHAWTSIPDSVTDYLKYLGHDGIKDTGGKGGGESHTVWIPFSSEQVKSAEAVTRDDSGNVIPLSERFNPETPDIRYSLSNEGEQIAPVGNYNVFGKDIALSKQETETSKETQTESEVPFAESEETVAENATVEHSVSDLVDIAKQGRRENMRGAYTHNGKQYLSDGSFVAEFNTVDESLEQSEDFPIKQAVKELDESFARKVEGNYDLHATDAKGFIKVGNSLFGSKRVNAIIRAFENPVFSLAKVRGGHEALVVTADNGRAVLMPVRASGNAYLVYEAQPIAENFPDDLAPMDDAYEEDRIASLDDADMPPETEAPITDDAPFENGQEVDAADPFADRDVPYGNEGKKQKAYMYENPEVKSFFQAEALALLEEYNNGTKGEKWYNDRLFYESGGEEGWGGTQRHQSESIDRLSYEFGLSYEDIEKGLNAIIEDNGAENIAAAKKIEFVINDRLMYGYKPFGAMLDPDAGKPNQDYIALMQDKQRVDSLTDADAPPIPEVNAPVKEMPVKETPRPVKETAPVKTEKVAQIRKAEPQKERFLDRTKRRINDIISMTGDKGWAFENLAKKTGNREVEAKYDFMKNRVKGQAQEYLRENLLPIYEKIQATGKEEDFYHYAYHLHNIDRMSLETEAERVRRAEIRKQLDGYTERQIESIASEVITRNTPQDRVNQIYLAQEYIDLGGAKGKNKPVYGSSVTADVSRKKVAEYEAANPEFKELEQAILDYNKRLIQIPVKAGLLTQAKADMWARMYPHYVPIRRTDRQGKSVSVPLDANKTGVNNPFKRATGGNSDFVPLVDAMAMNTEQIFYAIARNDFGTELMGALETSAAMDAEKSVDAETRKAINAGGIEVGTRVKAHDRENIGTVKAFNRKTGEYTVYFENQQGKSATVKLAGNILTPLYTQQTKGKDMDTSELLESTEANDKGVLVPSMNGQPPQFTVFVKGKPVTFDITEEMYKAMKPAEGILGETYGIPNKIASGYKKVLTEYDPFFALFRNPVKDTKDVLFNSQHAAATYATAPKTVKQIATKGNYYQEFIRNGGKSNTYYDTKEMSFTDEANKKTNPYQKASENFEMFWRLSEYIASREAGRSEKVSMLDAARVTTNFGAGGDFTKWLNRNGALFLNPSVQGVMQIGRNVREAYHGGVKSSAILAAKVLSVGLGGMFFNWLLWDDDEDYEELSDYVKQNYFCIWKTSDGKFIRIPKGRMEAVIQNGFEQMQHLVTGDGEADLGTFAELVANNIAPNNPLENNIISPIAQAVTNKTWYGDDLVPTRLQDLPAAEQYDEGTDSISKWVGEKAGELGVDISPYKMNYVMKQYGGGFADMVLPIFTDEAEGDTLLAPIKDQFVSDPVMKNQNASDFYDKVDELTVNANGSKATDEDILMYKYMNAKNTELSKLYKQKREVQNSDKADSVKWQETRAIQQQINELAKESLNSYETVNVDGHYATVGDVQFRWYEPSEDSTAEAGWRKISNEEMAKQEKVSSGLGVTADEYWNNKAEYDMMYSNPEKYAILKESGISIEEYKDSIEEKAIIYTDEYSMAAKNPGKYAISKAVANDVVEYYGYTSAINDIEADKDSSGKSISGSRKEKVLDYINSLDLDYGQRVILYRSVYTGQADKNKYNAEIVNYLNSRDDISYDEMVTILEELDMTVDANGRVSW